MDSVVLDHGGWIDRETAVLSEDEIVHRSVGFIVSETDAALTIATSRDRSGSRFQGGVIIPKAAIIARARLVPERDTS